jgi:lysozyme
MKQFSQRGLELTKHFEGLRLKAYLDGGGVPTIGYGHTNKVKMGDVWTAQTAEQMLRVDVADSEYAVNRLVKVEINQDQFDALVDFVFNLGEHAFETSTLLRKLNAGDVKGASAEFPRWNKDNGVVVKGLTARRVAEQAMFNSLV